MRSKRSKPLCQVCGEHVQLSPKTRCRFCKRALCLRCKQWEKNCKLNPKRRRA